MLLIMKFAVIGTFIFAIFSLFFLALKTFSFGIKKHYATPRGDVKKGIIYAFGKGMMPWEKESAGNHLPTYFAGLCYHTGIFLSLFYLTAIIIHVPIPPTLIFFFQVISILSAVSGLGLLIKRLSSPMLKAISCADDFAANLLVDVFLIASFLHTIWPGMTLFLFTTAAVMFLYIPLGKIRHFIFFFYVRILFGIFYGRRGIFPSNFATKAPRHQGTPR
jgi:hypothetical protein